MLRARPRLLRFNLSVLSVTYVLIVLHNLKSRNMCSLIGVWIMSSYLYLYDCKEARRSNARRVAFTKELYGYTYTWKTKSGIKEKRKPGLLDECVGSEAVADSAILVPEDSRVLFESLFSIYKDILSLRVYEIVKEI